MNIKKFSLSLFYKVLSYCLPKTILILYVSSKNDLFSNISSIANEYDLRGVKYIVLTYQDKIRRPFYFVRMLASAKVIIVDAAPPAASIKIHKNTSIIQCWHAGGAYKKMGFDAKRKGYSPEDEEKRISRIHSGISYFVCSSYECAKIYAMAFHLNIEKMLIFGVPRLDATIKKIPFVVPERFTILYAPTFRTDDQGRRFIPAPPDIKVLKKELCPVLGSDIHFAFRGHPTSPESINSEGWENWSALPQNEALQKTSVLITDYSSIFFDFLPFNRPIIFYVPDFFTYISKERGLYFSPQDFFPETTCFNQQQLVYTLVKCKGMNVNYKSIWDMYMAACDGYATERVCSFVEQLMEKR